MSRKLSPKDTVAVIGAGTMGAGIALVAARAGHQVRLVDADDRATDAGIAGLHKFLKAQVSRGKLTSQEHEAQIDRIIPSKIDGLADAKLVIEAIVEDIEIKTNLFQNVEANTQSDTILATNTSSLSITALASRLDRPTRFVGMHFFNPAPLLPLVEVIGGRETDPAVLDNIVETATAWGKVPVRCRSTPGFIVNRIARPFYGEALRLLSEGAVDAATIDAIQKECGGFRMGPFELMDMIGNDVNFAVTTSVYRAMFDDPRYRPSLLQKELVDAGWLGRKSGRGFFDYRDGATLPKPLEEAPACAPIAIEAGSDLGPATSVIELAREAGITVTTAGNGNEIRVGDVRVALTDGRLASDHASTTRRPTVLFDLSIDYKFATRIAIARSDDCSLDALKAVVGFFQAIGKQVSLIDDIPGLVIARTYAMLINEGADALLHGIASAKDIDLSMTKGVNYPVGPLAACDRIGVTYVVKLLDNLAATYGEERYRCSTLLRRKAYSRNEYFEFIAGGSQ